MNTVALISSNTTGTDRPHTQAARKQGLDAVVFGSDPGRHPFLTSERVSALASPTSDLRTPGGFLPRRN